MTFSERYQQVKNQERPMAPASAFVHEVATVTKKSNLAVRRWISGETVPDALTQQVIADYFNTTADELFPSK